MPTAANLNLCRGWVSHVGWHSDNEPLFGVRKETKLIVSVSFGTQALFKWKGESCPSNEGNSCWLGHGDILIMDGQCQEEFFIVRIPVRIRNGLTLRSVGSNNIVLPVPSYGQGWHVVCQRVRRVFPFLVRRLWEG